MAELTDPRQNPVACPEPSCRAEQGDMWCYTPTGWRRHWHAKRIRLALGEPAPAPRKPSTGGRPSHKQGDMLAWAIDHGGTYEITGYTFAGEAQKRAAMTAMVAKDWFRKAGPSQHGTLYEITDGGRQASARYEKWMHRTN